MAIIRHPGPSSNYFRLWSPQWSTGVGDVFSTADVQLAAGDYEVNVFQYQQLDASNSATRSGKVDSMKAVNAKGVVAAYVNGTFIPVGQSPSTGTDYATTAYHPSGSLTLPYLVDNGPTFLMDMRSRDWVDHNTFGTTRRSFPDEANFRRGGVGTSPFNGTHCDGFLLDNLGMAIISPTYNRLSDASNSNGQTGAQTAAPNPDTGSTWTSTDGDRWMQLTTGAALNVAGYYATEGSARLFRGCNGAGAGDVWFQNPGGTRKLCDVGEGIMFESWVRNARDGLGVYKSENNWILDCNAFLDLQNKGRYALMWCKVWAGTPHVGHINNGGTPPIQSSDDDGNLSTIVIPHRLTAASFMLCTDGMSFYHFVHDSTGGNERIPKDRWFTHINNLGPPIENFKSGIASNGLTGGITAAKGVGSSGNLYARHFTNGVVVVNPTGATTSNVYSLPAGTYMDVDSSTYTGTATVSSGTYARILVKQ
jgi:hypothetical protein